MRRLFLASILVAIAFIGISCNKDDAPTIEFHALQIIDADVPESFAFNGRYEITVTYVKPDDCTYFEVFDVAPKDTTIREVVAIGSTYVDQQCAQVATEQQQSFLFDVKYDQTYLFRFWQGTDADGEPIFLDIEVPVE